MSHYAGDTEVPIEKSKMEIERIVTKYGATAFVSGNQGLLGMVIFEKAGRRVRFNVPMPELKSFAVDGAGRRRKGAAQQKACAQAGRQRWRALALCIKAKLEAVEIGITDFEEEFLAHIVLPDGRTAGEFLVPQLEEAYRSKKMPLLLSGVKES